MKTRARRAQPTEPSIAAPPADARAPLVAAWLLVGAVFAANVYRAATQSVVHDEALTYNWIVSGPWKHVLRFFDANHHMLASYLTKLSVDAFGPSELSLRLTSLAGGALYLAAAVRLTVLLFGARWRALFPLALLTLDPAVLDFMSAARGYGPGLALLAWALVLFLELLRSGDDALSSRLVRRRAIASGALLGLSAAANLTYAIPGAAFTLALAAVLAARALRGGEPWLPVLRRWGAWIVAPGVAVFVPLVAPPLRGLRPGAFYVGAATLAASGRSFLEESFAPRDGLLKTGSPLAAVSARMIEIGEVFVPAVLVIAAAVLVARAARRSGVASPPDEGSRPCGDAIALVGGGLLLAVALMVLANVAAGTLFPEGRSGIYVLPLVALCSLCLVRLARPWRPAALALALPVVGFWTVALALHLLNFDPTHYRTWLYDRSTRRYVDLIRAEHAATPHRPVHVGMSWQLEPSINFYRQALGLRWMAPATRAGPRGPYDYYVLWMDDRQLVASLGLREIARDEFAGTVLAARPTAARR